MEGCCCSCCAVIAEDDENGRLTLGSTGHLYTPTFIHDIIKFKKMKGMIGSAAHNSPKAAGVCEAIKRIVPSVSQCLSWQESKR